MVIDGVGAESSTRSVAMLNGFEFSLDDAVYYVGAADLARARIILADVDERASRTTPRTMPDGTVLFLGLADGTIISGKVRAPHLRR